MGSHSCKTLFAPAERHFLIDPLFHRIGRGFRGPASSLEQTHPIAWGHARPGQPRPSSCRCVWSPQVPAVPASETLVQTGATQSPIRILFPSSELSLPTPPA